jgi:hypothetical protein
LAHITEKALPAFRGLSQAEGKTCPRLMGIVRAGDVRSQFRIGREYHALHANTNRYSIGVNLNALTFRPLSIKATTHNTVPGVIGHGVPNIFNRRSKRVPPPFTQPRLLLIDLASGVASGVAPNPELASV